LQQSVLTAQELPAPLQVLTDEPHLLETGSHDCEQHCVFDVHAAPATVQTTPEPPPPPVPVLIVFTELLPQLGRASKAAVSKAKMAAMEREVGEGLMVARTTSASKRLTLFEDEPFSPVRESLRLEWVFS
jgi:hypothetical protein